MPDQTPVPASARVRVTSRETLDQALDALGRKQADLEALQLDLRKRRLPHEQKLRRIDEEVAPQLNQLTAEIDDLVKQATAYVAEHKGFLFGDGSTADLANGSLKIQHNPLKCVIDAEAKDHVIEMLRRMQLEDAIRTTVSVDLQAMKRHRKAVDKINGVRFVQEARVTLAPALSGTPITVPLGES